MIESFKTLSMTQSSMTYKPKYKYLPPVGVSVFTPLYDFGCTITGLGKRFKTKVLSATLLSDSMVVADIGCGTGVFLKIAKQKYPRVQFVGLDPDKQALGKHRSNLCSFVFAQLSKSSSLKFRIETRSLL